MIIESDRDDSVQKIPLLAQSERSQSPEPSGSTFPPPPFIAVETSVDEATLALGSPPEFAPYQAEYFEQANRDVVSHDPHLNSDGEALYRFLLSQSQSRPTYRIQCRGTHDELQSRWVTERDSQGNTRSRRETQTETVVDFDFCIDVHPEETDGLEPILWSVYDNEPAYRGKMIQEYDDFSSMKRHKPSRKEKKQSKEWTKRRLMLGLPPWIRQQDDYGSAGLITSSPNDGLKSSKTIRQWADEYCASPKYLKEFVYQKVLYGWNLEHLEIAIRSTIKSVPYNGSLSVEITPFGSKVYIRPNNKVSRMLSNMWLKFLSILLLMFPFIWLYKRFHPRGGGRWEVCGAAYPLKQWVPLAPGEEFPSDFTDALPPYDPVVVAGSRFTTSPGNIARPLNRYMQTPAGPMKSAGTREGEWFRRWESTIRHAVIGRYKSHIPLATASRSLSEVELLDGYNEAAEFIRY